MTIILKGINLASVSRPSSRINKDGSRRQRTKKNLELVIDKLHMYSRSDADSTRFVREMFARVEGLRNTVPKEVFLEHLNERFSINLSIGELTEMMVQIGQDPALEIHPYEFLHGVTKSDERMGGSLDWAVKREKQMAEQQHSHPATFSSNYSNALRSRPGAKITTPHQLKDMIRATIDTHTSSDADRMRQAHMMLGLGTGKREDLTRGWLKHLLFDKFGLALSDGDIDRLFPQHTRRNGRVDFYGFLDSILEDHTDVNQQQAFFTAVREKEMADAAVQRRSSHPEDFEQQYAEALRSRPGAKITTPHQLKDMIRATIDTHTSSDADRMRQAHMMLGLGTGKREDLTRGWLKHLLFDKFGLALSDGDIDRLFPQHTRRNGRVDFYGFLDGILEDHTDVDQQDVFFDHYFPTRQKSGTVSGPLEKRLPEIPSSGDRGRSQMLDSGGFGHSADCPIKVHTSNVSRPRFLSALQKGSDEISQLGAKGYTQHSYNISGTTDRQVKGDRPSMSTWAQPQKQDSAREPTVPTPPAGTFLRPTPPTTNSRRRSGQRPASSHRLADTHHPHIERVGSAAHQARPSSAVGEALATYHRLNNLAAVRQRQGPRQGVGTAAGRERGRAQRSPRKVIATPGKGVAHPQRRRATPSDPSHNKQSPPRQEGSSQAPKIISH